MNLGSLGIGVAWFQLIFGCTYLVWGLTGKSFQTRYFAPIGLWFILGAALHFLGGHVPDVPLIALYILSFAGVTVWAIRTHRAVKAQVQELIKQRASSKS